MVYAADAILAPFPGKMHLVAPMIIMFCMHIHEFTEVILYKLKQTFKGLMSALSVYSIRKV